jgi:hypothetical protein
MSQSLQTENISDVPNYLTTDTLTLGGDVANRTTAIGRTRDIGSSTRCCIPVAFLSPVCFVSNRTKEWAFVQVDYER